MIKSLHIINFTVPYPADYGGVIDLFYKLPALQQQGVEIYLHCYDYGRGKQIELNKYCKQVFYYTRKKGLSGFSFSLPYIVSSRVNEQLVENLLQNNFPILLEGVHSCFILNDERLSNRKKIVRLHNVEYLYYLHLHKQATNFIKSIYYWIESKLLKNFEKSMQKKANFFLTVTEKDKQFFQQKFGFNNVDYLPLFLPNNWNIDINEAIGSYCLYQADLSVDANEKVALWLLQKVFNNSSVPLIIAGKNPSQTLISEAAKYSHCTIYANPAIEKMQQLIADAQINILPSFTNTGIKLKLLNALYNGKHCLVNTQTVDGTGLQDLCIVANTNDEMKNAIEKYMQTPFNAQEINKRKNVLLNTFSNNNNAAILIQHLF